jgi:microcystin-dependent protein
MEVYMGLIFPAAFGYAPSEMLLCQGQVLSVNGNTALYSLLGNNFGGIQSQQTFGIPDLRGRVPVGIGNSPNIGLNLTMGSVGGTPNTTLGINNLPLHNHAASFTPITGSAPITITVGSGGTGLNANVAAGAINGTLTVSTGNGTSDTPSNSLVPAKEIISSGSGDVVTSRPYGVAAAPNTANWSVGGTTAAQQAPVNGTISTNANMVIGGNVAVGQTGGNTPISNMQPYLGLAYLIVTQGLYPTRP